MYKVNLSWMEVNSEELGFNIYRDTSPLDIYNLPPPVVTLPPNTASWEDEDPPQDTQVYYIVSAFDDEEEVYGDEISVYVGEIPVVGDEVMILNVKGPISLTAESYDQYDEVDVEYSQDGTNWDTYVNDASPVSEGKLYLRAPEGTTIDRLGIARNDAAGNFLGVEKWWDVGCNLQLGAETNHNFTVPDHAPPNVTDMADMFYGATAFNQDIFGWDVSKVTGMDAMFNNASSFNGDIGNWDVSNVAYMNQMFRNASGFNQNLSSWCVTNIPSLPFLFNDGGVLNPEYYPVWGTCPA